MAERKDVLSTLFFLLTVGSYLSYVHDPSRRKFLVVLLTFAMGLMAKPMLVTLPTVLLLLDFWPCRTRDSNPATARGEAVRDKHPWDTCHVEEELLCQSSLPHSFPCSDSPFRFWPIFHSSVKA